MGGFGLEIDPRLVNHRGYRYHYSKYKLKINAQNGFSKIGQSAMENDVYSLNTFGVFTLEEGVGGDFKLQITGQRSQQIFRPYIRDAYEQDR